MAFVTLAGLEAFVVEGTLVERTPILQGARHRMADNSVLSTERDPKRVLEFQIDWQDPTAEATMRAAYPRGAAANATWPDGDTIESLVDFGDTEFVKLEEDLGGYDLDGVFVYKRVSVHIEEA